MVEESKKSVIDGTGAVLGRLASNVAKRLLNGETIIIINAEKIVKSGSPDIAKKKYLKRRSIGSPQHGPFYPIEADEIVRRAIRGMLPYKNARGRDALKRLRVYSGSAGLKGESMTKELKTISITLGEISNALKGRG